MLGAHLGLLLLVWLSRAMIWGSRWYLSLEVLKNICLTGWYPFVAELVESAHSLLLGEVARCMMLQNVLQRVFAETLTLQKQVYFFPGSDFWHTLLNYSNLLQGSLLFSCLLRNMLFFTRCTTAWAFSSGITTQLWWETCCSGLMHRGPFLS